MGNVENTGSSQELNRLVTLWKQSGSTGNRVAPTELCSGNPDLLRQLQAEITLHEQAVNIDATLSLNDSLPYAAKGSPSSITGSPSNTFPAVPNYRIESVLGRGGMGVVYRARQLSLNRQVALKMVSAGNLDNEAVKQRFRVEAEAVAALDHSSIIPIYEVGEYEGHPFYCMKLVDAGSLADLLQHHVPSQGIRELIALLEKICRAVHHAHERGVIHRDIKPSNILLEKHDQPMLADFGLAKLSGHDATLTGLILGTPRYMAPEQASGQAKAATTRSDVYSLGVILYEILAGHPPYSGDDPLKVLMKVTQAELRSPSLSNPGLDRGLEAVCIKSLAKDPESRYTSAAAPGGRPGTLAEW